MAAFLVAFLFVECHGITAKTYKNLECAGKPAYIAEMKVSPKLNLIYYSLFFFNRRFFCLFCVYLFICRYQYSITHTANLLRYYFSQSSVLLCNRTRMTKENIRRDMALTIVKRGKL